MASRMELQKLLKEIVPYVYFQEPQSTKMHYPCIRYERTTPDVKKADNNAYLYTKHYTLICISTDPENDIAEQVIHKFQLASPGAVYKADNLYHEVVSLYW